MVMQDLADGDKARVAKVKADMPPVPKQAKPAKEAKADKAPRAKSAYMVSTWLCHVLVSIRSMYKCTLNICAYVLDTDTCGTTTVCSSQCLPAVCNSAGVDRCRSTFSDCLMHSCLYRVQNCAISCSV